MVSMVANRRVLVLSETDLVGGAEVLTRDLILELGRRGWDVLFGGPPTGTGWLSQSLARDGVPTFTYPFPRALNLTCLQELQRQVRRFAPRVIHSHEFSMAVYGSVTARRTGLPHVFTIHGNPDVLRARRRRVALRLPFAWSTGVAVSASTRDVYCDAVGVARSRMHVIANGVGVPVVTGADVRAEFGIAADTRVLLALGTVTHRKGHVDLVEACARLQTKEPWSLLIAGRPDDAQADVEAAIVQHGLSNRVHLLGLRHDTGDLLAAANVFVMPSRWEGLPLAVLEAMHMGLPVIATTASGIPEAIAHGREGLLVDAQAPDALAGAIDLVLADPTVAAELGARAQQRARAQFSLSAMADGYERLLAG